VPKCTSDCEIYRADPLSRWRRRSCCCVRFQPPVCCAHYRVRLAWPIMHCAWRWERKLWRRREEWPEPGEASIEFSVTPNDPFESPSCGCIVCLQCVRTLRVTIACTRHLLRRNVRYPKPVLIFCPTKRNCQAVCKLLATTLHVAVSQDVAEVCVVV
jgi:hypothetical protein